ncbi:MAG: hypothetical protein IT284_02285 [Bacteroidetes bacterium]|nr:hypothetical protein [Bacteroidota bacterium]
MNEAKVKVNIIRGKSELKPFYLFVFFAAVSFTLYIFFIGQTIFRLVAERSTQAENRGLSSEISELELDTLTFNESISIDKAYELGFVDAKDTAFVTQKDVITLR